MRHPQVHPSIHEGSLETPPPLWTGSAFRYLPVFSKNGCKSRNSNPTFKFYPASTPRIREHRRATDVDAINFNDHVRLMEDWVCYWSLKSVLVTELRMPNCSMNNLLSYLQLVQRWWGTPYPRMSMEPHTYDSAAQCDLTIARALAEYPLPRTEARAENQRCKGLGPREATRSGYGQTEVSRLHSTIHYSR